MHINKIETNGVRREAVREQLTNPTSQPQSERGKFITPTASRSFPIEATTNNYIYEPHSYDELQKPNRKFHHRVCVHWLTKQKSITHSVPIFSLLQSGSVRHGNSDLIRPLDLFINPLWVRALYFGEPVSKINNCANLLFGRAHHLTVHGVLPGGSLRALALEVTARTTFVHHHSLFASPHESLVQKQTPKSNKCSRPDNKCLTLGIFSDC